jgi:two-component system OmpR family response regulator
MAGLMAPSEQIIVVDDDRSVREAIADYLAPHGFEVRTASGGAELDRTLAERPADLVILDLMMPGEDGLSICRRLADQGVFVLMLSALGGVPDRVVGLELGAGDYLVKPFDPRELLARVRALLRRNRPTPSDAEPVYQFEGWRYDSGQRRLLNQDGQEVVLTRGEHLLLRAFLERPGRVLSREHLLDITHAAGEEPFDRAVDLSVSRLRRKLGAGADMIETAWGAGYRLRVPVRER